MVLQIPSLSKEYVKIPITEGPSNLVTLDVDMAIVPEGADPSASFANAVWVGTNAAILIGPGTSLALTRGVTYDIWVKITSAPEEPVLGPYPLHIT